jgi:UDP-N-acetylmuramate: L-alanyl-gamma-D-glutamyl-meso-diaminopimelate ligase
MKHFHFIAIGGAAMHNMAIALLRNGHKVTGSDDQIFDPARSNLNMAGILPEKEGWYPEKITDDIDAVILGMHAREDNPELKKAEMLGLKIYSFPGFIFEHSSRKKRIVIGGSHGKTTVTGMILHVMQHCGSEPDYLLGASVPGIEGNVRLTETSVLMIIEGDEYLTSPVDLRPKFHLYKPHVAVITGIAWDHINVFKTFDDYRKQFQIFTDLIEPDGKLIYCAEDEEVCHVVKGSRPDIDKLSYILPPHEIRNGITVLKTDYGDVSLEVFGNHNLLNIEAARLACLSAGIDEEAFYRHISTWKGAYNRLTKIFENENLVIFRDFAHAPSKVQATLSAVRMQFPDHRLIACLELHTYSSLSKEFLPQYCGCLDSCDMPLLYFSPHAVQLKKLDIPDRQDIQDGFSNHRVRIFSETLQLKAAISEAVDNKTVILYMSSGNFDGMDLHPEM